MGSSHLNLLYGHKTIAGRYSSWLTTAQFHRVFNDSNNVLNTGRAEIHFRKGETDKPRWCVIHPLEGLFSAVRSL